MHHRIPLKKNVMKIKFSRLLVSGRNNRKEDDEGKRLFLSFWTKEGRILMNMKRLDNQSADVSKDSLYSA